MRRLTVWLAAAGLAVLAAGCGDDGTSSSTTEAPATTPVAAIPSTAELEAMLLDEGDVADGWKLSNPVNPDDLASFAQIPCEDTALNPTIAERLVADTGVQFEPTDGSYAHILQFVLTGDPARLAADLQILHDATMSCPEATTDSPVAVDELSIPELGDQRYGLSLTASESPEATWYIRSAVVREGPVAIGLDVTEILPDPSATPTISDDEVVRLLETAVAKMEGSAGS
jgi:hypothetical protein